MSAIMAWVEKGSAPSVLVASHSSGGPQRPIPGVVPGVPAGGMPPSPAAANAAPKVDRTRPVYPYPVTAKYLGTGSTDDARNFGPGPEKPASAAQMQWLGSGFYSAHYEQWCKGQGAAMSCSSKP